LTVFAVRFEVMKALFADSGWKTRFEKARNLAGMQEIICEFGRAKGWKVVEVTA
jgi:hypothetical protein